MAGFTRDDLEIVCESNLLTVRGKAQDTGSEIYLHRGIAGRAFERRFDLAEYVEVTGASLENGLLEIALKREMPEALKPRAIPIGGRSSTAEPMDGSSQPTALKAA